MENLFQFGNWAYDPDLPEDRFDSVPPEATERAAWCRRTPEQDGVFTP